MNRIKYASLCFFVFLPVFVFLISSCATTPTKAGIRMTVDSISARNASSRNRTYIIRSNMDNINHNDLEFQEVARYVENALFTKGYTRTEYNENADLMIRLAYGMGAPVTSYQTYTTSGAMAMPIGGFWFATPPKTQTIKITSYLATLVLEAYDLTDINKQLQLWKTTTKLGVLNPDLRAALPLMVAASADYFGKNTGKQITITIHEDDPRIVNIRK